MLTTRYYAITLLKISLQKKVNAHKLCYLNSKLYTHLYGSL